MAAATWPRAPAPAPSLPGTRIGTTLWPLAEVDGLDSVKVIHGVRGAASVEREIECPLVARVGRIPVDNVPLKHLPYGRTMVWTRECQLDVDHAEWVHAQGDRSLLEEYGTWNARAIQNSRVV